MSQPPTSQKETASALRTALMYFLEDAMAANLNNCARHMVLALMELEKDFGCDKSKLQQLKQLLKQEEFQKILKKNVH